MKKELPDAEDIVEKTEPTKTGKDFAKLTEKAITLGATALNYSNRKNTKDFVRGWKESTFWVGKEGGLS